WSSDVCSSDLWPDTARAAADGRALQVTRASPACGIRIGEGQQRPGRACPRCAPPGAAAAGRAPRSLSGDCRRSASAAGAVAPSGRIAGLLTLGRTAMCGIVGAIADRDVVPVLVEGLKRLEYRGYDSSGIAVADA